MNLNMVVNSIFDKASPSFNKKMVLLLSNAGSKFGITSKSDIAAYLANVLAEVGSEVKTLEENLNYKESALTGLFKNFTPALAKKYGRNEDHPANKDMIANIAYKGRNGNIKDTDGSKFKGRGPFQLTGLGNYLKANKTITKYFGFDFHIHVNPALVATDNEVAILSSFAFWKMNDLHGASINEVIAAINKNASSIPVLKSDGTKTNSKSERINSYIRILKMLG